ncbi:DUF262 domain-containing HNH endonuclease family protein [uncultured Maritimibacter sp.]|uniref:DUF262 domain-containing protein n=1 Tax=uncultured Maritimibacter sp. TaxID=991866 RepID=UPI00259192BA|nr:DUF262 domain-containing HNH endonuclease family protein [uncultured Maritimibacter sp.]
MAKKISGAEFPLSKIFSSDFQFEIPRYQRPYAWQVEQAQDLFEDLTDFAAEAPDEDYFLGSIVLIKEEGKPKSEVIDGQQRLTTLTVLLAVLVDLLPSETKDEKANRAKLEGYVIEPGNQWEGLEAQPRLTLRERDNDFFRKYVQEWRLGELADLDTSALENEAQQNIQRNAAFFRRAVKDKFGGDLPSLVKFIQFLLGRCFLVAVSTPNQASAFRVFSVMNSRGLELQPTDIVKADIIGKIAERERDKYNDIWEEMEADLGRDGFNDLFSHVRMIYAKEKARRSLLEEFNQHVLTEETDPRAFISDILKPFAGAFLWIRENSYVASEHAAEINGYLRWLNRLDFSDWVPSAIAFLARYKDDPDHVLGFFQRLERESAQMLACGTYVNRRIEVFGNVLREIEEGKSAGEMVWLGLTEDEVKEFVEVLDGEVYRLTPRRRNYIILRLDSFISDGGATYNPKILTIEHVLPQTVGEGSEWEATWASEEDRKNWLHRIGNLVPLNKRRNSSAQNYGFKKKCSAYFAGKDNVTSYTLTAQVLGCDEWTPKIVAERQTQLLEVMKDRWELHINDDK